MIFYVLREKLITLLFVKDVLGLSFIHLMGRSFGRDIKKKSRFLFTENARLLAWRDT
jgi:hypothetical protein